MLFFVVCLTSYCAVIAKYGVGSVATRISYPEVAVPAPGVPMKPPSPTSTTIPLDLNFGSWGFWQSVLLVLAFWLLPFFIGFLACSSKPLLPRGRGFASFSILLGVVLPAVTFMMISDEQYRDAAGLWKLSPVVSLLCMPEYVSIGTAHMLIMMLFAAVFAFLAHRKIQTLISQAPQQGTP